MEFEWDENKNRSNIEKHGIGFLSAARIFDGPVYEARDTRKDYGEVRIKAIGKVNATVLCVVYTLRGQTRRMISARKARRDEKRAYNEVYP